MIGQWDKPFAIKGILSVEDAKKAVDERYGHLPEYIIYKEETPILFINFWK